MEDEDDVYLADLPEVVHVPPTPPLLDRLVVDDRIKDVLDCRTSAGESPETSNERVGDLIQASRGLDGTLLFDLKRRVSDRIAILEHAPALVVLSSSTIGEYDSVLLLLDRLNIDQLREAERLLAMRP